MKKKLLVIAIALALVGAGVLLFQYWHPVQQRRAQEAVVLHAGLAGDVASLSMLRGMGVRGIELIETFVSEEYRVDSASIARNVARLSSPNPQEQMKAAALLTLLPERTSELIKLHATNLKNEEARARLRALVANRPKIQREIAAVMTGLYTENFRHLFVQRRDLFQKNCHDVSACLFFTYVSFDEVWRMLRQSGDDVQLRFLLLRLFSGRDGRALEMAGYVPASRLLRMASETWWPVELDPPAPDGALTWTTRAAAIHGNTATHLLRIGIRTAAPGQDEWRNLDRWLRWTYVFRMKTPVLNKDAVVYAEQERRGGNRVHRTGLDFSEEVAGEFMPFWLPEGADAAIVGPGQCLMVRGMPKDVPLPVVVMSKDEGGLWHSQKVFEWARPLFHAPMQGYLRFEANRFPAPAVFETWEAAQQKKGKKPKR